MFFYKFCRGAIKFIMISRNTKKKSNLKMFQVFKSMFKTRFSHYIFSNTFNDKFWSSHLDIWVPNTTIEGAMKKIQVKQHFATTLKHLTKKFKV